MGVRGDEWRVRSMVPLTEILVAEVLVRVEDGKVRQDGRTDDGGRGGEGEPAPLLVVGGRSHHLVLDHLLLLAHQTVGVSHNGNGAQCKEKKDAAGV